MKSCFPVLGLSAALIVIGLHFHSRAALAADPAPEIIVPNADAEPADPDGPTAVSITEETFSIPIGDAFRLLHDLASDELRFARITDLVASGKARIERLVVLRTKSGQRAVVESINDLRTPTEYRPPEPPQTGPSATPNVPPPKTPAPPENSAENGGYPIAFETRNVGDTLEVEPIIGPDGVTIEINLVPQTVRYVGDHENGGPHPVKTPIFEVSKITTSVAVRDGHPYFLGTLNPPFASGLAREQKEQRVWLDFITVSLVHPGRAGVGVGGAVTAARAQMIRIPKLEFREASVEEALDFLRRKSIELDHEKKGINIVVKAPKNLTQAKVSLSLSDISVFDAVRYVANLAALVVVPDDSALLLRAAGGE
jgi:hypothetical protein